VGGGVSRIGADPYEVEDWMRPYLQGMGGEQEVVRLLSGPRARIQVNAPFALMQQGAEAQMGLLHYLHEMGLLADPEGYTS
jgi:hypothetical protein